MGSLFWKIQWEKEAVSSALTSALSLGQESGWPGRGGVGRKPAAGGPCDVRLPHGSQGRGLAGEEQGSSETHAGPRHARAPRVTCPRSFPETPPPRGTPRHGVRPPYRIHALSPTVPQRARESARGMHAAALSQPHTGQRTAQTHVCTHRHTYARTPGRTPLNPDVQTHKGPRHTRTDTGMPTWAQTDRQTGPRGGKACDYPGPQPGRARQGGGGRSEATKGSGQ